MPRFATPAFAAFVAFALMLRSIAAIPPARATAPAAIANVELA